MYKCVIFIILVSSILLPPVNLHASYATENPPNYPASPGVNHDPTGVNDPTGTDFGVEIYPFNWEKEWGTIHMNTYADGLNDPGASVGVDGVMPCFGTGDDYPCSYRKKCSKSTCDPLAHKLPNGTTRRFPPNIDTDKLVRGMGLSKYINTKLPSGYRQIDNAIKFDIKNSINNCMAKVMPNYPYTHLGWDESDQFSNEICGDVKTGLKANWSGDDGWGGQPTLIYAPVWIKRSNDYNTLADNQKVGCV